MGVLLAGVLGAATFIGIYLRLKPPVVAPVSLEYLDDIQVRRMRQGLDPNTGELP